MFICYVWFLCTRFLLPKAQHSDSNEGCAQMTKIKGEEMKKMWISTSCSPCSGWNQQHCYPVVIFAEIILRLADWSRVRECGQVERQCCLASELQALGTFAKTVVRAEIKSQRTLSVRDQMVNPLGFVGHVASVAATCLCHCSTKTAIDSMSTSERGCVPKPLHMDTKIWISYNFHVSWNITLLRNLFSTI